MDINKLREYADKLMFDMSDSEYETLAQEFEVILKQMDLISEIEGISDVEPMSFPFEIDDALLREDDDISVMDVKDALLNVKEVMVNQVKVPKVVGSSES